MERKALKDVYVMRPLAILLMVVWHSFIIYAGGWREPIGFQPNEVYWWVAKFSYSFMLELFVFISGYVFGLTLERKEPTFKSLTISKFKRLIIPSLVFSAIYYFCFYNLENFTVFGLLWDVLNGCGHMWFLPMLFWVTLIAFIIDKIKLPKWLKLVGVYCMPVLSLLPIPLGISSAMYYLPFLYTGLVIYRRRDEIIEKVRNNLYVSVLLGVIFVLLFIVTTIVGRDVLPLYAESKLLIVRGCVLLCKTYLRLLCAVSGIVFVYSLVNYLIRKEKLTIPLWIVELNGACFGVYIFQQFILQFLYYKTQLPSLVGPYWLPWVGTAIALTGSLLLSWLFRKTKLGRALI